MSDDNEGRRGVGQACKRAIRQSGNEAIVQSCNRAKSCMTNARIFSFYSVSRTTQCKTRHFASDRLIDAHACLRHAARHAAEEQRGLSNGSPGPQGCHDALGFDSSSSSPNSISTFNSRSASYLPGYPVVAPPSTLAVPSLSWPGTAPCNPNLSPTSMTTL